MLSGSVPYDRPCIGGSRWQLWASSELRSDNVSYQLAVRHQIAQCRVLTELGASHYVLWQGIIGPLRRLNYTAHMDFTFKIAVHEHGMRRLSH
jgi:hypothetical protein